MFIFNCTNTVRDKYKLLYNTNKYASKVNPVYEELKKLNLNCKSISKYIPDIYKFSSLEQRLDLVKGLMDTDGSITKSGSCSFANTSKKLVEDLQEVLYSLGISSTFRKRKDNLYIIYINTKKIFLILQEKHKDLK